MSIGLYYFNRAKNVTKIKNWNYVLRGFEEVLFVLFLLSMLSVIISKFFILRLLENAMFLAKIPVSRFLREKSKKMDHIFLLNTLSLILMLFSIKMAKFLVHCGDIESNPGFEFMQWNCNSLPAHNLSRIPLIEV